MDNKPREKENRDEYLNRIRVNRQKNVKPLMDHIDTVILHLSEEVAEEKAGKYITKQKNTYSAAPQPEGSTDVFHE